MAECPLIIFDKNRFVKMFIASVCIIVGETLSSTAKQASLPKGLDTILEILGILFFVGGWAFVGYNLYQTIPDNAKVFIPAIISIAVSSLAIRLSGLPKLPFYALYVVGWGMFGVSINNPDLKWVGPIASGLAVVSMLGVMPWQRNNCVVDGIGLPIYGAAWSLITILHAVPTIDGLKTSGIECLKYVGEKDPKLGSSINKALCVMDSGCFDKIKDQTPGNNPEYIDKVVQAAACAGEKCTKYKKESASYGCVAKNCVPPILQGKPSSMLGWGMAMAKEYGDCKKKCPNFFVETMFQT